MLELDGYLERVGIGGGRRPSLAELHRAHVTSIPFENLDPHRGTPVSLQVDDLASKLVQARRGGYCFEHNLLFKAALEALGAEVDLMLARVRLGAPPGTLRPRTHLVLRVRAGGAAWHADVGFGAGTPLEPLRFGSSEVHEQAGWRFRVVDEGEELVLQTKTGSEWTDLYGFAPRAVPLVDVEMSNWFTSSHPDSRFVTGLLVCAQRPDGTRTMLSDWSELALVEQTPSERTVTPVEREAIPGLLDSHFGLAGFTLNHDGRVVPAVGA